MHDTGFLGLTSRDGSTSSSRHGVTRRSFLVRSLGVSAGVVISNVVVALLDACGDPGDPTRKVAIDLSSEIGVLNYVYAVTQLEYDFYYRVTNNKFPGMLASESSRYTGFQNDLYNARSDLQITQIPSHRITDVLLFRLGEVVDFANRQSVTVAAQTIEDAASRSFAAAQALMKTPSMATVVADLATAASARADAIRGSAVVQTPISPIDAMEILTQYFLTTITITNG